MTRINVAHFIGGGEIGGAEEHVMALLTGLNPQVFQPYLVCLVRGPLKDVATAKGIHTKIIPMSNKLDIFTIGPIRKFLKENNIHLVHTHGARANLVARIAAKTLNLPIITTCHSSLKYDYARQWEATMAQIFDKLTAPLANHIIAISEAIRQELIDNNYPAGKISTIYNGINFAAFKPVTKSKEEIRAALNLTGEGPVISVVARLHPVKGHVYFFQAIKLLQDFPETKFLVVGDGILRTELEKLAQDLGIAQKVIFTGYRSEINEIMVITDILCLPSLMEGLGLVLLEGMYYQVPCVATNVGGIPEVVQDGINGLLVPPQSATALADALTFLLQNPEKAHQMGQQGKARLTKFSLENMVQNVEKLYHNQMTRLYSGGN